MSDLTDLVDESRDAALSWRSAGACLAAFVASLCAGALLLDRAMPPYLGNAHLRAKLEHWAAHGDRYDTFFIGSSRVHRHVVPEVFDRTMAATGLPTRSFNFGVGDLRGLELEFVLERLLALRPEGLRFVWIEPGDPAQRDSAHNRRSERFVAWHDSLHTWRSLDLWLGGERAGYDWGSWSREHLPALARRTFQLGRARQRLRPAAVSPARHLGPAGDGFQALDWSDDPRVLDRRAEFLGDPQGFHEKLVKMEDRTGSFDRSLEPFERRFLARLRGHVEEAGAQPIFLVPPAMSVRGHYVVRAAAEGVAPLTFHYADPALYPVFYERQHHFDDGHLNLRGARLFSRRLAEDFAGWQRKKDAPTRLAVQNWK